MDVPLPTPIPYVLDFSPPQLVGWEVDGENSIQQTEARECTRERFTLQKVGVLILDDWTPPS